MTETERDAWDAIVQRQHDAVLAEKDREIASLRSQLLNEQRRGDTYWQIMRQDEGLEAEIAALKKESAARGEVIRRLTDVGTKECPDCGGTGNGQPSLGSPDGWPCHRCEGRGVVSVIKEQEWEIADLKDKLAKAQRPEIPDKAGQPTVADLIAAYEAGNPADDHAIGLQNVAELVRRETAREICLWIEDTSVPLGDVPVCEDEDFIDLKAKYGVTE